MKNPLLFTVLFFTINVYALQTSEVSLKGCIIDAFSQPLKGASIECKWLSIKTESDSNGQFVITTSPSVMIRDNRSTLTEPYDSKYIRFFDIKGRLLPCNRINTINLKRQRAIISQMKQGLPTNDVIVINTPLSDFFLMKHPTSFSMKQSRHIKKSSTTRRIDTLIITKDGYEAQLLPVDISLATIQDCIVLRHFGSKKYSVDTISHTVWDSHTLGNEYLTLNNVRLGVARNGDATIIFQNDRYAYAMQSVDRIWSAPEKIDSVLFSYNNSKVDFHMNSNGDGVYIISDETRLLAKKGTFRVAYFHKGKWVFSKEIVGCYRFSQIDQQGNAYLSYAKGSTDQAGSNPPVTCGGPIMIIRLNNSGIQDSILFDSNRCQNIPAFSASAYSNACMVSTFRNWTLMENKDSAQLYIYRNSNWSASASWLPWNPSGTVKMLDNGTILFLGGPVESQGFSIETIIGNTVNTITPETGHYRFKKFGNACINSQGNYMIPAVDDSGSAGNVYIYTGNEHGGLFIDTIFSAGHQMNPPWISNYNGTDFAVFLSSKYGNNSLNLKIYDGTWSDTFLLESYSASNNIACAMSDNGYLAYYTFWNNSYYSISIMKLNAETVQ